MKANKPFKTLKKILGDKKVKTKEEYLYLYSYDATRLSFLPSAVVFPENEKDIIETIKFAVNERIPITPRGAGVGYTGGAIPVEGGISLVFTKMNKIKKISVDDTFAIVEPGVITYELQKEVEKAGLFYPPDPASLKTSTIGGNIAENAGGPRCFKYGVTGNYVLSLKVALMNGEIIRAGAPTIKDVTGYDLKSLIVGSEGTLAIITEATLRLIPLPKKRALLRIGFKDLISAVKGVSKILTSGVFPSALEFMDKSSIESVFTYFNETPPKNTSAFLIVELDGEESSIINNKKTIKNLFSQNEITEFLFSDNPDEMDKIWEIRRAISPAIVKSGKIKVNEDVTVPRSKIPEAVEFLKKLGEEYNVETILFGHIGDGNIHTNFMLDHFDKEFVDELLRKMFKKIVSLGGTLSGEHGIGITKKEYIPLQLEKSQIELLKKIKKTFDPLNLLNPGKIIA